MLLDSARTSNLSEDRGSAETLSPGRQTLPEGYRSDVDATIYEQLPGLTAGGELDELGGHDEFISHLAGEPKADQAAPAPRAVAPKPAATRTPGKGGNDALGKKENTLLQWKAEMVEVADELAGLFTPLGLHFRPEILLATAMQEAAVKDPLNAVSFDKGLGLMQITPYKGKLDPQVAKAINWDNSKSVNENIKTSNWRNAKANLRAGAQTMLGKAKAIKRGVPSVWEQMDEPHRWRAVLFAYNAGEGSAISALKRGGANATMISSFTNAKGERVSHDYTKEIKAKMDYVDSHDPFDGSESTGTTTPETGGTTTTTTPETHEAPPVKSSKRLTASVGRGGANHKPDVGAVQERLSDRGLDPGKVDSLMGPKTIGAIETFQESAIGMADGLITPGKNTEKHLFFETGKVTPKPETKPETAKQDKTPEPEHQDAAKEEKDHPAYAAISQNFNATISGTSFTWHEALWLPSWKRHVQPSDVTNIGMDTLLANVARQAAALTKVREAVGKSISVHCWVRPPAYNKQIGGASNSAHLRGTATDFHCPGMTAEQVRQAVKSGHLYPGAGENGVSWVHLDLEHKTWFSP